MALDLNLKGKPIYYGLAIGGVIAIAIVVVVLLVPVKKLNEEIASLDKKLKELQVEIDKGKQAKERLNSLKEELAKLEKKLQELSIMLPTKRETHIILKRVKSLAEEGDFSFTSFVPSEKFNDKEFYYEWPISVTLEGTYHNLAIFFDKLRTLPRIINVADMNIKGVERKGVNTTISTKIILHSYIQKEETEEVKEKKTSKGGKK